jgi:hypothetical protein
VGSSERSAGPITLPSPSFLINGAGASVGSTPRWDRVNSQALIALARQIYFRYLSEATRAQEPTGVVVCPRSGEGRVVFEPPTLLPDEEFLSTALLRNRSRRSGAR